MNPDLYPHHLDEVDGTFLDKLLRHHRCHADLESCGQCVIEQIYAHDEHLNGDPNKMKVTIDLRLYATICAPSGEDFNYEAVIENEDEETLAYFASIGADPRTIEDDWETNEDEAYRKIDKLVEYYRQQAEFIMTDITFCDDPFAVMWNDDAWEGGIDVTLETYITPEEWEEVDREEPDPDVLDDIELRLYKAIENGGEQVPAMTQWESAVYNANERINKLNCYTQPKPEPQHQEQNEKTNCQTNQQRAEKAHG